MVVLEPDGPRRYPALTPNTSYTGSYTITANFLHYVAEKYDKDLVKKLNVNMARTHLHPRGVDDLHREGSRNAEYRVENHTEAFNPPRAAPGCTDPAGRAVRSLHRRHLLTPVLPAPFRRDSKRGDFHRSNFRHAERREEVTDKTRNPRHLLRGCAGLGSV